MHTKKRILVLTALFAGFALSAPPVSAAYINIDDSDLNSITISAGDFEGGFSVNGSLLTTGLGGSGAITLADGNYSISGSWIDLGQANGVSADILFALPGNPSFSTSGIQFGANTDGFYGNLSGSFSGYIDPSLYFNTALPTLAQNGQTGFAGVPFLSVSFISESVASVPEPASLALMGLGLIGIAGVRRRKTEV